MGLSETWERIGYLGKKVPETQGASLVPMLSLPKAHRELAAPVLGLAGP